MSPATPTLLAHLPHDLWILGLVVALWIVPGFVGLVWLLVSWAFEFARAWTRRRLRIQRCLAIANLLGAAVVVVFVVVMSARGVDVEALAASAVGVGASLVLALLLRDPTRGVELDR